MISCCRFALSCRQFVFFPQMGKRHFHHQRIEKQEIFSDYLKHRIASLNSYLASLPYSSKEAALQGRIKQEYANRGSYKEEDIFAEEPFSSGRFKTLEVNGVPCLSRDEVENYSKYGFVGPIKIKTITQDTLSAIFSRYTGIPKTLNPQEYREARVRQEWQNSDLLRLASNPEIVSKVSSLLGDNIKVRFTGIHEVPPGVGSFSSITSGQVHALCAHSDTNLAARLSKRGLTGPFVDLDSINVWFSITGTTRDNGPLYVFPKTHKWSVLTPYKYLEHSKGDADLSERTFKLLSISGFGNEMIANHMLSYQYIQESINRDTLSTIRRTEVYTEPGECLIFSSHLMHGSDVNSTATPRLAISIRYSSALKSENEDTLNAVKAIFSPQERTQLGLIEGDTRTPIIQVLGKEHHTRSCLVDLNQLKIILSQK